MQLTIERLESLAEEDVTVQHFLGRLFASSYEEFLEVLSDDLITIVKLLEQNPQPYADESEDATTQRIVDMLSVMGYTANHNAQSGGNVDITVELIRKKYKWIAEAKKFTSVTDLREGYLQLATRYRPGTDSSGIAHGGLLAYLRRPNAVSCVESWQAHLQTLEVASGAALTACPRRHKLGFISEHPHKEFGIPFRVWHVCIVLSFDPKDKSGRDSQKYQ